MIYIGVLVTLLGFVLSVASVAIASGAGARLVIVLLGLSMSLFGIMGILNPVFLKNAIWRKS
jgi:predicted phage tail protein